MGRLKVAALTFADIDALHRRITASGASYAANRVVALCSRLFSLSVRWGHRADNPAKRVERNKEYGRRRYAKGEEVRRPRIATHTYIAIRKKRPSRGRRTSDLAEWFGRSDADGDRRS